ncbi:MAG TPA: phytase, partial [Acidimicrobiia bacterium]|nr:phytase [Acidimicrobiia bacterium]
MASRRSGSKGASSLEYALLVGALVAVAVLVVGAVGQDTEKAIEQAGREAAPSTTDAVLGAQLERRPAGRPAVWVDPTDPAGSVVVAASQTGGGLTVFDLRAVAVDEVAGPVAHDVDLRDAFRFGEDGRGALVVAAGDTGLATYRLDPASHRLTAGSTVKAGSIRGVCLHRGPASGEIDAFTYGSGAEVEHWRLTAGGEGSVEGRRVRVIRLGAPVEACAADDLHGELLVSERGTGLWRYPVAADDPTPPVQVDRVGAGGLVADVDSIAFVDGGAGRGYVVASSEGDETLTLYHRSGDHAV